MTKRIEIEFKSSVEIMNTPMKKRRFIVDEMIYPGLHVLSGDPIRTVRFLSHMSGLRGLSSRILRVQNVSVWETIPTETGQMRH